MPRDNYSDLVAFITIAREGSFTRAADQLGVSQSALSHTIRALESRLGVRLLTRTTRSVSPTEAGRRLLLNVAPRFEEIEAELVALSEFRDTPSGTIRITTAEHAANIVLWPKLEKFLGKNPDVKVEVIIDYGLVDIVEQRYDAGIRLGEDVEKDMIAACVSPDLRMAVVGTPDYFSRRHQPTIPQDLSDHNCINLRLPTRGGLYAWEFEKEGRDLKVHVEGQLIFNSSASILRAALGGLGLAYVPEDRVLEHISEGRLIRVLEDWCPSFPGYFIYYPNRLQSSPALAALIKELRYRG